MHRIKLLSIVAAAAVFAALPNAGRACSTFMISQGGRIVVAKNFDMLVREGCLFVNKRGVEKFALSPNATNPARWTSRYGSVSFNQVAREYPMGGMNEAGLVVEIMWLDTARYPVPDDRPVIPELQWIQYQLDNCATVDEVLATDAVLRIESTGKPVHFFVADRSGDAATVEFVDGALVSHRGESLPAPALTNDTYDESIAYLGRHEGFGGGKRPVGGWESLDRFVGCARAARDARRVRTGRLVPYAFESLRGVAQGDGTVWSIVYDVKKRIVRFRTVGMPRIRVLALKDCDFSCDTPVLSLDLFADLEGNVAPRLEPCTVERNRDLIQRTFKRYAEENFLKLSEQAQEYLARYPELFTCAPPAGSN